MTAAPEPLVTTRYHGSTIKTPLLEARRQRSRLSAALPGAGSPQNLALTPPQLSSGSNNRESDEMRKRGPRQWQTLPQVEERAGMCWIERRDCSGVP